MPNEKEIKRDKLKAAGQITLNHMIHESGGVFTTQQVSSLLNINPSAVIKKKKRGRLLALPFGESISFPVWQFNENGVVENFAEIMAMLNTSSPFAVFRFFLTYDEDLKQTPINALKEGIPRQISMVKTLAAQFNQQVSR